MGKHYLLMNRQPPQRFSPSSMAMLAMCPSRFVHHFPRSSSFFPYCDPRRHELSLSQPIRGDCLLIPLGMALFRFQTEC